ncbi:MAG: phosphoribosylanthranilate isomerase [Actinomycetota bacterium]
MPKGEQPTFIKICGITRVGDARAATRAGANAIGFLFAPSVRRISASKARQIGTHVHPTVRKIGVFVDSSLDKVLQVAEEADLDGVQLQGAESASFIAELKGAKPSLFVSKVLRVKSRKGLDDYVNPGADAIMVDRRDPSDTTSAPRPVPLSWLTETSFDNLVVAGGLGPANVGRLIREIRPWGVDVSSGVESAPGKKDPEKIRAFVRAVRGAEGT